MRALRKEDYIHCVLTKIRYNITLFIYDVQMGQETYITQDVSMKHLPVSFRYYDPIF